MSAARLLAIALVLVLHLGTKIAIAQETGAGLSAPSIEDGEAAPRAPGPASLLGDPRPDEGEEPEPAEVVEEAGAPWDGPRVELGYTHYVIVDGFGGGDVHAGFFGGYLPTGALRLGGSAELGGRDYSLGQSDLVLRATIVAGYQHLPTRPIVPYAAVVATAGVVLGKRFRTPVAHPLGGAGLEIGADLNLVRTLYVGVGLSYVRAALDGPGYDLWVIRLRIGL